ncbi:MAG: hydroxyacid dehydrogenase [Opitutaceae bacterium]
MQSSSICHLCLTDVEYNDFLKTPARTMLESLFSKIVRVDSFSFADADAWFAWLEEVKPEVLVSCWKTPTLPEDPAHPGLSELKYLCHLGGSVRKLVPRSLIESGLVVTNWGSCISRVVAECGLLLILTEMRRSAWWSLRMHREEGAWKDDTLDTQSLFDRKVGLHGFGGISRCLVDLLKPFGVSISAFSPSVPDELFESYGVSRADTIEDLFSNNDIIVELAALTPKNYRMIDERLLRMIPDDGVFVNIGRGAVVDEAALARVASEGRLRVALDVYETEPLPKDSPLRAIDSITLLPHLAGPTVDQRATAGAYGVENLKRFVQQEALVSAVDLWGYDHST